MTNVQFYKVSNNTISKSGFPWIQRITSGLDIQSICVTCNRQITYASGDISVLLDKKIGTKWGDILGCGHFPFFIVSDSVINGMENDLKLDCVYHKLFFDEPIPKKLVDDKSRDYFWIDGYQLVGANVDFEQSSFVETRFCAECGTRRSNIAKTFEKQREGYQIIFHDHSWNGLDLFTTDLSPTQFFCTDKFVNLASKHKFTNFLFEPIERLNTNSRVKY